MPKNKPTPSQGKAHEPGHKGTVVTVKQYRSYNFLDKDPIIDRARTILQDSGYSYEEVNARSDVAVTTLRGWFEGRTRRPQFATLQAFARGIGKTLDFVDFKAETRYELKPRKRRVK